MIIIKILKFNNLWYNFLIANKSFASIGSLVIFKIFKYDILAKLIGLEPIPFEIIEDDELRLENAVRSPGSAAIIAMMTKIKSFEDVGSDADTAAIVVISEFRPVKPTFVPLIWFL
jgi:hypothetical protein